MPYFDFSAISKSKKKSNRQAAPKEYKNIKKGVNAVCFISLEGRYMAVELETQKSYVLSPRSFNIKTNEFYAQQLIDGKRIQCITLKDKDKFDSPQFYLPFAPGVGLIGNIIENNFTKGVSFDLIKTFKMPKDNEIAKQAFLFYRNNYKEIYNKILEKYCGESV